jgi:type I restriction enzyme S subunit
MVNMGELFAHHRLLNADMDRVPLGASEAPKFLLKEGDLLFARQSLVLEGAGKCSIFLSDDEPVTFESHVTRVRIDKKRADSLFYFYYFQSHHGKSVIRSIVEQGAGASGIRGSDLHSLEVLWVPLREQRAIAHILGTLDDKIELNRRRNETLEAMARALFQDWFVDFGPVRAKVAGRQPYLPADLWQLFPGSFDDEGRPQGWVFGRLGEVADHPRRSVQPEHIAPGTPYIALEHMPRQSISLAEWGVADDLESAKHQFFSGEILFGKLRSYFHKAGVAPVDGVCSTDIVVISPKALDWFGFVLGHVSGSAFVEYTDAGSTGTKMPRTSWSHMASYEVILPPQGVAAAFNQRVSPLVKSIRNAIHEAKSLAQLRDTLLPKLISGELRIKDAERFMEEHAA